MKRKERSSGKVVVLIEEEVILTKVVMEEKDLVVIGLNVVKDIESMNVNNLEGGMKVIMAEMF